MKQYTNLNTPETNKRIKMQKKKKTERKSGIGSWHTIVSIIRISHVNW